MTLGKYPYQGKRFTSTGLKHAYIDLCHSLFQVILKGTEMIGCQVSSLHDYDRYSLIPGNVHDIVVLLYVPWAFIKHQNLLHFSKLFQVSVAAFGLYEFDCGYRGLSYVTRPQIQLPRPSAMPCNTST